jgi:IS30 family transposase
VLIADAIASRTASAPWPASGGPLWALGSSPWPSMRGRCSSMVNRVVRSTRVAMAKLFRPMSKSAVATLVDRRSRYLRLIHLPDGHRADQLVTALEAALVSMSADKRLTLTWDQGSEMARHDEVARLFSQGVFFANPGSPWMRGTNENTNGLVRQYLPKGTDLRVHDAAGLAVVETKLNTRPRKILGWRTSTDVFGLAT